MLSEVDDVMDGPPWLSSSQRSKNGPNQSNEIHPRVGPVAVVAPTAGQPSMIDGWRLRDRKARCCDMTSFYARLVKQMCGFGACCCGWMHLNVIVPQLVCSSDVDSGTISLRRE